MMRYRGPKPKTILVYLVNIAIAVFIFLVICNDYESIRESEFTLRTPLLLASIPVFLLAFAFPPLAWRILLKAQGDWSLGFFQAYRIWFYSFMGRYIPGKVAVVVIRAKMAKAFQIPAMLVTNLAVVEVALFLSASIFLSIPLMIATNNQLFWPGMSFIAVAGICLFLLQNKAFIGLIAKFAPFLGELQPLCLPLKVLIKVMALHLLFWLVIGTSFVIFLYSVVHVEAAAIFQLIAAHGLSSAAGMLAFFAPGGIGFREATLGLGIQSLYGQGSAYMLSVLTRLWSTSLEVIALLLIFSCSKLKNFAPEGLRKYEKVKD